ncbi:MAG: 16S rRNA (guanine(966)-N(2))-methyltransferase RsmD [Dehalococcoidales bacterium]|nr:16S rRNA (guanine(966)-N(2))-methyltransferase RsmD [Dehalococcoidales bacterium]
MRVIAGKAKGHRLKAPKDASVTRPATDLVRGAIFSILETMTGDWRRVLDLFSGSGALGIEALSRGAEWVDFVEREPRCCDIIKQNLEKTRFTEQAHIYCRDVAKAILFLDKEYSIILIDPPYSNPSIGKLVARLAGSKLVGAESIVVVTHSPRIPLDTSYSTLNLIKERRHGDSCISVYKQEDRP